MASIVESGGGEVAMWNKVFKVNLIWKGDIWIKIFFLLRFFFKEHFGHLEEADDDSAKHGSKEMREQG